MSEEEEKQEEFRIYGINRNTEILLQQEMLRCNSHATWDEEKRCFVIRKAPDEGISPVG